MSCILSPGHNCWRVEHAGRMCVIIDAADYFAALKAAMLKATNRIMLLGWDFDSRVGMQPEPHSLEGPNGLGRFLAWLVKQKPDLHIYLLKWDLGMLQALGRGMLPLALANFASSRRLHFKLDGTHPVGAAHHQKIAVIDDALAFCGGIDITVGRWDTREHRDDDARRRSPYGKRLGPWHDATTAVDGAVACALSELARERWCAATGERLPAVTCASDLWPDNLEPSLHNLDVAIARTLPGMDERAEVREIEALYLAAIASARHTIYLESQYLAARRLAEALAQRLREPDGPEIIIVLPQRIGASWLQHETMDSARARLLHMLWDADRERRLRAYYPVTSGGAPIFVHAKIMVIDDTLLRVGSSNLNNRSLGFDSECDLAVEAADDDKPLRKRIATIRRDLLCEHLGTDADAFDAQLDGCDGSILATIEALRGDGRSLRTFDPATIEHDDSPLAENDLMDPEGVASGFGERLWRGMLELFQRKHRYSQVSNEGNT